MPWSPPKALLRHLWNSSGAGEMLNGILVQRYRPHGVPKVVRKPLSVSNWTCQKPLLVSTTLKTFALESSGNKSSITAADNGCSWGPCSEAWDFYKGVFSHYSSLQIPLMIPSSSEYQLAWEFLDLECGQSHSQEAPWQQEVPSSQAKLQVTVLSKVRCNISFSLPSPLKTSL